MSRRRNRGTRSYSEKAARRDLNPDSPLAEGGKPPTWLARTSLADRRQGDYSTWEASP